MAQSEEAPIFVDIIVRGGMVEKVYATSRSVNYSVIDLDTDDVEREKRYWRHMKI
ncbi:MAG: hypothetical protein IK990_00745 [Ruminiclostridium sp.]|nr:hypothetical protein [Ruminococcus sp.]MBP3854124.1 hypothetical protein [Ruminiclostridium sp.]